MIGLVYIVDKSRRGLYMWRFLAVDLELLDSSCIL